MIKLIASDLDGTLLKEGTQIHAGDLDNTYIFRECQFAAVI